MIHTVPGTLSSAFTHFAQLGLAHILQAQGADCVRLWWQEGQVAQAMVSWSGELRAAEAVYDHARRRSCPDSWVQAIVQYAGRGTGLFSPRVKAPASVAEWRTLGDARASWLDGDHDQLDDLDHRMVGALGEPAYWLCTPKENQPDQGASRWEMKTRNRGEEFVGNRLARLARTLAVRQVEQVASGLSGATVLDDLDQSPASRSATGFARPGPVDSALAWCALWGIAATRLVPRAREMSQTSGSFPRNRVHPAKMALPVFGAPVSPSWWRSLAASAYFDRMAFGSADGPQASAAALWLTSRGVLGAIAFPVLVAGSKSSPERQLLDGVYRRLAR